MRNERLKKKGYKIDTTNFPFGKRGFLRDPEYLKSFDGCSCFFCKICNGTIIAGHIRTGSGAGVGIKPDDSNTIPMCGPCHAEQHKIGEEKFFEKYGYTIDEIKAVAKDQYHKWREE